MAWDDERERERQRLEALARSRYGSYNPAMVSGLLGHGVSPSMQANYSTPNESVLNMWNSPQFQSPLSVLNQEAVAGPTVNKFTPVGSDYSPADLNKTLNQHYQNVPSNVVPITPTGDDLAFGAFGVKQAPAPLPVTPPGTMNMLDFIDKYGPVQSGTRDAYYTKDGVRNAAGDLVSTDPTGGAIDQYMATVLSNANMDNLYVSNATIGPVTATRQGTDWVDPDSQKFGTDQLANAPVLSHDYMSRDLGLEPVSGYVDGMGMPIHTGLRYPGQRKTAFELAQDNQDFDLATATAVDTFANMPSTGGFFPWPRAEPTGQDAIDEMETTTGIDTFSSGFPSVSPAEIGGFKPGFGQLEHSYGTPSASTPSSADINAALSQSFEVPASTMNNQGKFGVPYGVDVSTGEIAPFDPSGIPYTGQSAPQDKGIVSVVNALKTITDTIDKAKSIVTPTTSSGVTSVTTPTGLPIGFSSDFYDPGPPAQPAGPSAADIQRDKQAAVDARLAQQAAVRLQQQQQLDAEIARQAEQARQAQLAQAQSVAQAQAQESQRRALEKQMQNWQGRDEQDESAMAQIQAALDHIADLQGTGVTVGSSGDRSGEVREAMRGVGYGGPEWT